MECSCCEGPLERHQLALSPALRIHTVGDSLSGKVSCKSDPLYRILTAVHAAMMEDVMMKSDVNVPTICHKDRYKGCLTCL